MTSLTVPNTFTASTVISSSEMNANFTAVVTAFAASLGIDGAETMTGTFKAANGTAALPGITFGADPDLGLYRSAANTLGFAAGGASIGTWGAAGLSITTSSPRINLTDSDTGADSRIDADNATGSLVYSADLNNEVGSSTHVWALDGTNLMVLTPAALTPNANDGLTLGTASLSWADLFLASGGVINFNNGNATITHSADTIDIAVTSLTHNSNPLGVALPMVQGLIITNNASTPTTSLDIDADNSIISNTSDVPLLTGAVNLTIDATTTGANALDTGSLANDTWYYAYIISNGSTTAGLLSTSATSPTMPSGYTFKYRVGAIRTGGSATFVRIRQVGNRAQYEVVTSSTTPSYPIIASGILGNVTTPTYVSSSVANYVPPTATRLIGGARADTGSILIASPNNDTGGINDDENPPYISSLDRDLANFDMVLEGANIYYAADNADSAVFCFGWVDAVNAC